MLVSNRISFRNDNSKILLRISMGPLASLDIALKIAQYAKILTFFATPGTCGHVKTAIRALRYGGQNACC